MVPQVLVYDRVLTRRASVALAKVMILGFGSLAASTPYLAVILLVIVLGWLNSASSLAKQFATLAENDEELKAELA